MPVSIEKLDAKLAALAAKDLPALVEQQARIPFLPKPYTLAQLQAWIDKRTNQLFAAKEMTDEQILTVRVNIYNGLSASGKALADKIIAGELVAFPSNLSAANYDRLVAISLIVFVTE